MQTDSTDTSLQQSTEPVRYSRGGRTELPVDPNYARLMAMITALAAELSVTRERLDTCERLAQRAGVFTTADVERFEPDTQAMSDRARLRGHLLETVFRPLEQELDLALANLGRDAAAETK
jgi:hypothetical protein